MTRRGLAGTHPGALACNVPRAHVYRTLGFGTAFVVAGFIGRSTIIDATATSLVWPAAGVACLWVLATRRRQRWITLALIGGLSFLVNKATGSDTTMALVFVVANVLQAHLVVWLSGRVSRRWPPIEWHEPFTSAWCLLRLVIAATLGCLPSALFGVAAQWLLLDFASLASALTWWARNTVGIVAVASTGLLLVNAVRGRRRATLATGSLLEAGVLVAATITLVEIDLRVDDLPLVVFLPALAVWAGMRFPPVFVALHSLAAGAAAVWITLVGEGPFQPVVSPQVAALAAQLFVGMTVLVGLFLSMSRHENAILAEDVRVARDQSERQAQLLSTIIMSMHDGVVVVDDQYRVSLVNRAAARTVFASVESPVGTSMAEVELLRPDGTVVSAEDRPCSRALAGRVHRMDVRVRGQRDRSVHLVTATPLAMHADGTATGAVLVFHDVTDERAQQQALSAFASTVAHDLINPISAIQMWSDLLREQLGDSPDDLAPLARIESSTVHMRNLVDGLLADAQAREFTLTSEVVDLTEVARDAARDVPGADVAVRPLPPVLGDPLLLKQVLVNLIANAAKYAAPDRDPEITVSAAHDALGDVLVCVADRGIGIPADHLETVFEPFRRVPGTDRRGSGLGLAICQRIVERHGGRIVARRRDDGPGTVMEVTLPAAPADDRVAG